MEFILAREVKNWSAAKEIARNLARSVGILSRRGYSNRERNHNTLGLMKGIALWLYVHNIHFNMEFGSVFVRW